MGRVIGLLVLVLAIWAAAEVSSKGFDAAFGGALASLDDPVVALDELHSGGGRDGKGAPGARRDDDIVVAEDSDPFAPKSTPVTRVGAHVQGEIDAAYGSRYADDGRE